MSLVVTCPCGQALQTQPQHRGKRIRCPKCKGVLQVPPLEPKPVPPPNPKPAPVVEEELCLQPIPKEEEFSEPILEDEDEGYQLAAVAQCPKCKRDWPADTVLCVECGYNFKTGKQLKTVFEVRDRSVVQGDTMLGTYSRFTVRRDQAGRIIFSMQGWLVGITSGPTTVNLADYDFIATDYTPDTETYFLELQGSHKRPLPIWSGGNETMMRRIVDLFKGTGVEVKRK